MAKSPLKPPPSRHTSKPEASLASRVLSGNIAKPTHAQVLSLAASVLSQDAPKRP